MSPLSRINSSEDFAVRIPQTEYFVISADNYYSPSWSSTINLVDRYCCDNSNTAFDGNKLLGKEIPTKGNNREDFQARIYCGQYEQVRWVWVRTEPGD